MKHNLYMCELMDNVILNCTKQNNRKYETYRFFVEGAPKALLLLELKSDSIDDLQKQTEALFHTLSQLGYASPAILIDNDIHIASNFGKQDWVCWEI